MTTLSVISGFRRGVTSSLFWYIKHSRLVVTDVSKQPIGFLYKRRSWHFNMGPIGCPETSVTNYQSSLRDIPEEQRSPLFCDLRQAFTVKTLRSVIMLYTVIFSCSFVCDLKSCLTYYFEGSNVCLAEHRSLTGPTTIPLKRDQWIISIKGREAYADKPKHSEERKPVCHPFQQNFYMNCQGIKSRFLRWKAADCPLEPWGLRIPVTLGYSVAAWKQVEW
jgi:hypothetical protein